ncbi:hypothetical protein [Devosia sp. Root436]|uniref:hypothetical protein n=1 Tax=Devosia sp. Root436 TaxID=1736537 RepID=UPI0012E3C5F8|nr:hypothetical protein [Devosia sp. Root436]
MGLELRKYLTRIYRARKREGLAIGGLDGWARAICYVSARVDTAVNLRSVTRHCLRVGIDIPDTILEPVVREVAAARAAGALTFSSALVGEMIQLTAAEREEHEVRRLIDACDQPADDRRRATARERSAKRRADRGGKPRSASFQATKPWIAEGKTRTAWFEERRRLGLTRHSHPDIFIRKKGDRDETVQNTSDRDETVQDNEVVE